MTGRRKYLIAGALLIVAGSLAVALTGIGRSAPFPFRSVTPAELLRGGVTLSAATAPGNLPTTSSDAAASASKFEGGRRVLEVHYALCADSTKVPRFHQDCWAVVIDPHGLRPPSSGPHVVMPRRPSELRRKRSLTLRYDLVFVDATTGKVIEATSGS